jgi:hypothetical protein
MLAMSIAKLEKTQHSNVCGILWKQSRKFFKWKFFKKPTRIDLENQLRLNVERGWLSMLVSLDCMRYHWKSCSVILRGSFIDKNGKKSIILEAIVNQRLWI